MRDGHMAKCEPCIQTKKKRFQWNKWGDKKEKEKEKKGGEER